MARASKPIALIKESSKLTKKEIKAREEQEAKLKGNDNLVYTPPMNLTDNEKELYIHLVDELAASKILNNLDITILEVTVDAIIKMNESKKLLNKYGMVQAKEDGSLSRNPASTIYKDYNAIFNKCCMELGMSPSARAKLGNMNINDRKEKQDPLLQAIAGGRK